jgi:outer membrane autotransporter protein
VGAQLLGDIGNLLTTSLKAAWGHELSGTARAADLSLAGGSSYIENGAPVPGDAAVVGVGLAIHLTSNGAIYLHYDGELASHAQSHAVTAGLRFNW